MTMDREKHDGAAELRRRAEEAAREEHPPVQAEGVPNPDPGRTLQELRVHQIELEMQNAELLQIQEALEDEKARYYELYNLAPVGYCTLRDGLILEANATLAALLGVRREHLVWKALTMFIHGEAQDRYFLHTRRLFEAGGTQALDLRMVKMDRTPFWAHLVATVAPDSHAGHEPGSPSSPCCRLVLTDITERKQREEEAAIQGCTPLKSRDSTLRKSQHNCKMIRQGIHFD
jgi:PAS domain S-box-containing protein